MTGSLVSQLKSEILRLLKTGGMLLGALAILAAISALSANPLQTFFRLLSIVGIAMLVVSVVTMVLTFRKARTIEPVALLLSLGVTVVSTLFSLWLGGPLPAGLLLLAALLAGLLVGAGWSLTTLLFVDNTHVRGRGTAWYLVIWGLTFALNQIAAVAFGHVPAALTLLMLAGTGLTAGNTLGLLTRVRRVATLIPTLVTSTVATPQPMRGSAIR